MKRFKLIWWIEHLEVQHPYNFSTVAEKGHPFPFSPFLTIDISNYRHFQLSSFHINNISSYIVLSFLITNISSYLYFLLSGLPTVRLPSHTRWIAFNGAAHIAHVGKCTCACLINLICDHVISVENF